MASLIEDFLDQYKHEQPLYEEVASIVRRHLERILQEKGIKAVVSHRAKRTSSLRRKLMKRALEKKYGSVEDIYADIVDLAGVRVALYFPGDRERVGRIIMGLFDQLAPAKHFPADRKPTDIAGYAADHYRSALKDPRFIAMMVEIQVASVLMHAWSEVSHGLLYKPEHGTLTPQEINILKEVNAIVQYGEHKLEELQQSFEARTDEELHFQLTSSKTASGAVKSMVQKIAEIMSDMLATKPTRVFVVQEESGEYKPLMGFESMEEAERSYLAGHPKGWENEHVTEMFEMTLDELFPKGRYQCDFDGVLATHIVPYKPHRIGPPLRAGKALLDHLVGNGSEVSILTARDPDHFEEIGDWIDENMGHRLQVSNVKKPADGYIDDKAVWWPRNLD
jgi:ppGpp synthetase/RelA/SpoT-type nucleotidyltranferase